MARRVFLVGFMGCGKSSYGKRLAAQLKWDFLDTDKHIEQRAGMPIPEIFAQNGEEWFRDLERQVIEEAAAVKNDTVVALGGGAVCRPGAMEMLAKAGLTVYLKMAPGRLVRRMGDKGRAKRPKIAGMNDAELGAYIEKTLPEREKYYNNATFVLDCGETPGGQIVELLQKHLDTQNG